ncbi:signal peptidase II [Proteiniborus ethanoligenes]|uniref:Lipoprotein signal peptidase n=1 Tax=Proteiniborus ethanoligenes TaxID=415015 RepID=A0A1H3QUZ4_9FIRM|nr:signal peptidase II [Proteiniborus ethanoligenes]SDZ16818.1 signal peptidase II [Proteiniborus ethanoligenes]
MLYAAISLFIIFLDQLTKFYAIKMLKGNEPIIIIRNFLQLNYVENFGAAFGILQNKKVFFVIMTLVVIIGIVVYMKTNTNLTFSMKLALAMVIGGAVGNLIDRIRLGYVVDFVDVNFWGIYDFPVFNLADSFIVIGTIILMYLVIFNKYEN